MNDKFWISDMPKYTLCIFLFSNVLAMFFYPGGNINDPNQIGYSFLNNFFSDLGRVESLQNPAKNNFISCALFNLSLLLVGICFSILFYKIRKAFIGHKFLSIMATILGVCSGLAFVGVALTPVDVFLQSHVIFANWAFRFLFGASFFYAILIFNTDQLSNKYAYSFILFGVMVCLYVYYSQFYLEEPHIAPSLLPNHVLAQKAVVFWIFFSVFTYAVGMSKYLLEND